MKLSILIPSLAGRYYQRHDLIESLQKQDLTGVEILTEIDKGENSIGYKRNKLLEKAQGEYVAFIDDDDVIAKTYIKQLMEGINKGVDCCSLMGIYTVDDMGGDIFEHSIKYKEYKTNPPTSGIRYERYPNHLNCIKADIAKRFKFLEINHGEDTQWATDVFKSGLIKTEHTIGDVIYHYKFRSQK